MSSKVSRSRRLAYDALERVRRDGSFANDVIDSCIDTSDAAYEDKAFATKLVLGVVSTSGSLDAVMNRYVKKPGDIKGKLRSALRICTYEVIYLEKDAYAAVDQCVELVKSVQPRAAGLANAVMRKVAASAPGFPYGNPSSDITAYSLEHAFPEWLVGVLRATLGDTVADDFVRASNGPSPVYVHASSLKGDSGVAAKLGRIDPDISQVQVEGMCVDGCYRLSTARCVASKGFIDLVEDGQALVSDASAQLICQLACEAVLYGAKKDHLSCLELCAGRGTKTVLLQSAMMRATGAQFGRFIAVDNMAFKAALLATRAKAYGAHLDESLCADGRDLSTALADERFDLVFLDAPCSGLGTLRRHPEIRWRVTPEVIKENAALDLDILSEAAKHVAPGGVLAYSTCTVTQDEDEGVVRAFLATVAGQAFDTVPINDEPFLRTKLREDGYDSHFCSLLRRKEVK